MKEMKIIKIAVRSIVFIAIVFTSGKVNSKNDTIKWECIHNKLVNVFFASNDYKRKEFLKLYDNNFYEYLIYTTINGKSFLKRDLGKYKVEGKKIKLIKPNKSVINSFLYKTIYFIDKNKNLHETFFDAKLKNKSILKNINNNEYDLPFYLDPDTKTIVNNESAEHKLQLTELITELIKNATNEREKVTILEEFIIKSITYSKSHVSRKFSNNEEYVKSILAGKYRFTVCGGYSEILNELCKIAKIDCRVVIGIAKNSTTDVDKDLSINHAWNIIKIEGKQEIHDITFADGNGDGSYWLNAKPEIAIYSHFPENENDQLLEKPFTKNQFINSPGIFPARGNYLYSFDQINGTVFADSIFKLEINSTKKDFNIVKYNSDIYTFMYHGEKNAKNRTFTSENVSAAKISIVNEKTIIEIPLKDTVNCFAFKFNGFQICYKVVKGTRKDLYKYYQHQNIIYLESYIKSILASIYLNDKNRLVELVGEKNPLFFDKKGRINEKNPVIKDFQKWDGKISEWLYGITLISNNESKAENPVNKVLIGNREIYFIESDSGYKIVKMN